MPVPLNWSFAWFSSISIVTAAEMMTVQFLNTKPRKLPVKRHRHLQWLYIGHSSPGVKWECVISWGCRSLHLWVVTSCRSCLRQWLKLQGLPVLPARVNTMSMIMASHYELLLPVIHVGINSHVYFLSKCLCFLNSFHRGREGKA